MWILILTLQFVGNYGVYTSMATAEFSDAKACDIARDTWLSAHVPKRTERQLGTAYCFPKSSTIPTPEKKQ